MYSYHAFKSFCDLIAFSFIVVHVGTHALGYLYDVNRDKASFGHTKSWVEKNLRSDHFYRLIYL